MSTAVHLSDIVERLHTSETWTTFYFDRRTGEIVPIEDSAFALAEKPFLVEFEPDGKPDPKQIARAVLNGDERYVQMPSPSDVDEYGIMERFCFAIEDDRISQSLSESLKEFQGMSRFEQAINRLGIIEEWHGYLGLELRSIAKRWCEENEIDFIDDV